jgi:ABC-2 type transport system ATP-binding protein
MSMSNPATPRAPQAGEPAIEARGLRKVYKGDGKTPPTEALKSIDLVIPRGSIFGLLGPNGAGKSTFINILAGIVTKTSGTAVVWGNDIDTASRQARASIGVVPQELNTDPFFTPAETLEQQAGFYGVPKSERRTMEILESLGLADKADAYSRTLSGGMRRRLLVGKAMVHSPPILVLDEPTAGVDIELRRQLWDQVRELHANGTTIVLTTHYLEEAEELCDRIAIIDEGRVVACDTTPNLLAQLDQKALLITPQEELAEVPTALISDHVSLKDDGRLHIAYQPSTDAVDKILNDVRAAGILIRDISTEEADLEDIFLQLTYGGRTQSV